MDSSTFYANVKKCKFLTLCRLRVVCDICEEFHIRSNVWNTLSIGRTNIVHKRKEIYNFNVIQTANGGWFWGISFPKKNLEYVHQEERKNIVRETEYVKFSTRKISEWCKYTYIFL